MKYAWCRRPPLADGLPTSFIALTRAVARADVASAGARATWASRGTDKPGAAAADRAEATIRAADRDAGAADFADPPRARMAPRACAAGRDARCGGSAMACSRERVRGSRAVVPRLVLGTAVQRQRHPRRSATQERPPGSRGLPAGRASRLGNQERAEGGSHQSPQREEQPGCLVPSFSRIVCHPSPSWPHAR
jgi:hypothetical protein